MTPLADNPVRNPDSTVLYSYGSSFICQKVSLIKKRQLTNSVIVKRGQLINSVIVKRRQLTNSEIVKRGQLPNSVIVEIYADCK